MLRQELYIAPNPMNKLFDGVNFSLSLSGSLSIIFQLFAMANDVTYSGDL